jgi:hypothetical protein
MQSPSPCITQCDPGQSRAPLGGHSADLCLQTGHLASRSRQSAYIRAVQRPSLHLLTISRRLQRIVRAQFAVCIAQLQAGSWFTVLTPTQTADSQQSRSCTLHGCTSGTCATRSCVCQVGAAPLSRLIVAGTLRTSAFRCIACPAWSLHCTSEAACSRTWHLPLGCAPAGAEWLVSTPAGSATIRCPSA